MTIDEVVNYLETEIAAIDKAFPNLEKEDGILAMSRQGTLIKLLKQIDPPFENQTFLLYPNVRP